MLVRRDLAPTQIAVQAIHAAMEAARLFLPPDHPHPHLVLCGLSTERALLAAADRLERLAIRFQIFREPDRAGEATALATEALGPDRDGLLGRYHCLTHRDLLAAVNLDLELDQIGPREASPSKPEGEMK